MNPSGKTSRNKHDILSKCIKTMCRLADAYYLPGDADRNLINTSIRRNQPTINHSIKRRYFMQWVPFLKCYAVPIPLIFMWLSCTHTIRKPVYQFKHDSSQFSFGQYMFQFHKLHFEVAVQFHQMLTGFDVSHPVIFFIYILSNKTFWSIWHAPDDTRM